MPVCCRRTIAVFCRICTSVSDNITNLPNVTWVTIDLVLRWPSRKHSQKRLTVLFGAKKVERHDAKNFFRHFAPNECAPLSRRTGTPLLKFVPVLLDARPLYRQTYGYLPSCTAYNHNAVADFQIILLGDKGTCARAAIPEPCTAASR